jgi:4-amino-4-deoxy-L-arabinose transferase-like glycosyltransferase
VPPLSQVPRSTVVAWLLIVLVLAGGVYLRLAFREPKQRTPDEGFYTAYAIDAARQGPKFVGTVVRLFNESPRMRKYPRPTRVGYYLPAAAVMRATGEQTVRAPAALSTAASLLALLLCLGLAARAFGVWPALVALLFLAASPIDLTMARRAWVDPLLGALTLGMVVAYGRLLGRPERVLALAGFLLLGAWGLLVKESGAVALGCGCLGFAIQGWQVTRRVSVPVRAIVGGLLAVVAAIALLAWLCGGLGPLLQVFRPIPGAPASEYLLEYDSGGPGYYVVGLMILQPVPFVLGVLGAILVALRVQVVAELPAREEDRRLLQALAWFVVIFLAVAMWQNPKNMRQLSPMLVPLYLLAAVVVCAVLAALRRRLPAALGWGLTALAGGALAGAAFFDLDRFIHYFVISGVPDLATPFLLQVPR